MAQDLCDDDTSEGWQSNDSLCGNANFFSFIYCQPYNQWQSIKYHTLTANNCTSTTLKMPTKIHTRLQNAVKSRSWQMFDANTRIVLKQFTSMFIQCNWSTVICRSIFLFPPWEISFRFEWEKPVTLPIYEQSPEFYVAGNPVLCDFIMQIMQCKKI